MTYRRLLTFISLVTFSQACDCGDASCEFDLGLFDPDLYDACVVEADGDDDCIRGSCLRGICTMRCEEDEACPGDRQSGEALCLGGFCAAAHCAGPTVGVGLACIDGVLHRCADLEAPPCFQCGIACDEGEICLSYVAEPCLPVLSIGEECQYSEQCADGFCDTSAAPVCRPRFGSPCTPSDDLCTCVEGYCTAPCEKVPGAPAGTCPAGSGTICSVGAFTGPAPAGAGFCFPAGCTPGACADGQQCALVPEINDGSNLTICTWPGAGWTQDGDGGPADAGVADGG